MDSIGRIGAHTFPQPPTANGKLAATPKSPQDVRSSFQVAAATLDIKIRLNYVQLTGPGAGGPSDPAGNVQELIDKVSKWVHDLFDKNGIAWKGLTPAEAQKKVDQGGDQAPEAVSKRILDFVKAFDDGTPGRAQLLRDAVEKGFGDAQGAWGGKLPDISYKTMDLVRKGLDGLFGAKPDAPAQAAAPTTLKVNLAA